MPVFLQFAGCDALVMSRPETGWSTAHYAWKGRA
jgi:hypothetical protein